MLSAHYGFTGKFSAWRNTGGPRDWSTPGHRAARMSSLLTSRRRVRVSHGASHTSASVLSHPATSTRPSTKSSRPAASCFGEANSAQAAPTPTSPTRMATKSKFGMSEAAALGPLGNCSAGQPAAQFPSGPSAAASLIPNFDFVAIRVGDVGVGAAWAEFASPKQLAAGLLDFVDGRVDVAG